MFVCLFIRLIVCLFVCVCVFVSVSLSICVCVFVFVCVCACADACMSHFYAGVRLCDNLSMSSMDVLMGFETLFYHMQNATVCSNRRVGC